MYYRDYLLGSTIDNELVTCRIGLRDYCDKPNWLNISFAVYSIVPEHRLPEMLKWRLEDMDKDYLYDLCWEYRCAPQNLFNEILASGPIEDFIPLDTCAGVDSVFVEYSRYKMKGYFFEGIEYGQTDTQDRMERYVDEDVYNFILDIWRRCHMSHVDDETVKKINGIVNVLESFDEEEWIIDLIKSQDL